MDDFATGMFGVGVIQRSIEEGQTEATITSGLSRGSYEKRKKDEEEDGAAKQKAFTNDDAIANLARYIEELTLKIARLEQRRIDSLDGSVDVLELGDSTLLSVMTPTQDEPIKSWADDHNYAVYVAGNNVTPDISTRCEGDTHLRVYFDYTRTAEYTPNATMSDEYETYYLQYTFGDIHVPRA